MSENKKIFDKNEAICCQITCCSPCMVVIFSESYPITLKTINLSQILQKYVE